MTTLVQYGGVTMYNVQTRRWSQKVVYDESGTDVIGALYSLAFDGVIHVQRVPLELSTTYVSSGRSARGTAVASYIAIRTILNRARQHLRVIIGGAVALDVRPPAINQGDEVDLDNGPKPRLVDVTSIVSNSAFRVRFEIDAMVGECNITANNVVLSNRWSVTEVMDSNFYTTRTIDGTLRLAVSRKDTQSFPVGHQFRGLVFPTLEPGFKRENISFTAEADGLHCRYSITDKQVHHAAPWPATDMQVQHTEGTSDGIKHGSAVQIQLKGPPNVDKRLLIERAIAIADARLLFLQGSSSPDKVITRAEITDFIGAEAIITLTIHLLHVPESPKALLAHLRLGVLGRPLILDPAQAEGQEIPGTDYEHTVSPLPTLYGYSPEGERRPTVLVLLHAYLATGLCRPDQYRGVNQGAPGDDAFPENRDRLETTVQEVPENLIPESSEADRYRTEASEALYTISKITSEYVTEDMKVGMPLARVSGARSESSATNVVFDLCEPQAYRRIDIDVERVGMLPKIPEPLDEIRDGTLIATRKRKSERIYPPVLTADGRHEVFRVEATYWYILNRPPMADEKLRITSHHYANGLTNLIALNELYDSQLA